MPPKKRSSFTQSKKGAKPRSRSTSPVPPLVSPPPTAARLPTTRRQASRTPPPSPGHGTNRRSPPKTNKKNRHKPRNEPAARTPTPRKGAEKRKGISPLDNDNLVARSADLMDSSDSTADVDRRTAARADPQATWDLIGADEEPSKPDDEDEEFVYEDDLDLLSEDDLLEKALEELVEESILDEEVYRRIAIAYVYYNVLDAPPREEWQGKGGTYGKIKRILKVPSGTKIGYVLDDLLDCEDKKCRYTGKRQALGETRPPKIPNDSQEAQIVADHLELTDEAKEFMDSQGKDGNRPEWFLTDKLTKIDLTKWQNLANVQRLCKPEEDGDCPSQVFDW
ncbi:hypothetical protein SEMRO_313_G114770.1 [Seminavis robusta]|uniref:Uncharacterized protein n=1 Tax=Seminavis robusta TaxID=568900 RepID=A0A9N8DS44_9STRA|nr:hypothetical protein SEMRO_313_G114770.1 [Seminavis robusta]|eukprot:Sro313_g114770.1 n/a (337) ;mRNA; f:23646-25126